MNTTENKRIYRAPRGAELNTKGWVQEAALRWRKWGIKGNFMNY